MRNNKEIEVKYLIDGDVSLGMNELIHDLNITDFKDVTNIDMYFDTEDELLKNNDINLRMRKKSNKVEYTYKRKIEGTLIREELNYSTFNEVLEYIKESLNLNNINVLPIMKLHTERKKTDINFNNTVLELVYDMTIAEVNGELYEPTYMIEVELKEGNIEDFESFNKLIGKFTFLTQTQKDKLSIAKENHKNNIKRVRR